MTRTLVVILPITVLAAAGCASGPGRETTSAGEDPPSTTRAGATYAPERGRVEPVAVSWSDLVAAGESRDRATGALGRRPAREGEERWSEALLSEREIEALIAEAHRLPASDRVHLVAPQDAQEGAALSLGTSFESVDVLECCSPTTLNPPDPELAAGPHHLIAVVNNSFEIYDTAGGSLSGVVHFDAFFAQLGGDCVSLPFDPNVLYDEEADRFVVAADGNTHQYCVGVSQTGDPGEGWFLYAFPADVGAGIFDFPQAGIGRDALYVGANIFVDTAEGFNANGQIFAFDKTKMYAGLPADWVTHDLGANTTPEPIHLHGWAQGTWPTSGPHYILTSRNLGSDPDTFGLFSWNDPFGANVLTDLGSLETVPVHGVPVGFPIESDQEDGDPITGGDPRLLDFEYRNGYGWATNHVSCSPVIGTVNCVQWMKVDLAAAAIADAGVFSSFQVHRFHPDIAADHCGDALIGYSKSSSSTYPGIAVAGRLATDPPGTMGDEIDVKPGEVPFFAPSRWGDYTGMTIAPDGKTFWYLGEYSKLVFSTSNWGTWIASATFPDCSVPIFEDGFESGDTDAWDTVAD